MTVSIIDPDGGSPTPDYTDIRVWSNADRNLVSATDTEEGEIRPTSGSACSVTNDELEWNGYTTDDTYYVELRAHVDHKHPGYMEASPSYARVDHDSTTTWHSFNMNEHVHVIDLQIERQGVANAQQMFSFGRDGHEREVRNCLCHAPVSGENVQSWIVGGGSGDLAMDVINNVVTGYFDRGINLWFDGDHCDGAVYNNTIQHTGNTYECLAYNEGSTYRRPDTKNNLLENQGSAGDYDAGSITLITTATNYTSDATSPDGASYRNTTADYSDQANYDLRLAATDDGNFEGTDLSSDSTYAFSTDNTGNTRVDWDAGADEYISAGSTYEDATTLTVYKGQTESDDITMEEDETMALSAGETQTNTMTMEDDEAIALSVGETQTSDVSLEDDETFGVSMGESEDSIITLDDDASLGVIMTEDELSDIIAECNLTLTVAVVQDNVGFVDYETALSMSLFSDIQTQGGLASDESLTLAITSGISEISEISLESAITMAISEGMSESSILDFDANTDLSASVAMAIVAESVFEAGLTLNDIFAITQESTLIGAGVQTPDGRTIYIEFNSRQITLEGKSRTIN